MAILKSLPSVFYKVKDGEPVTLLINIGFGQPAQSSLFLDSNEIAGDFQNSFSFQFEKGKELKGKILQVITTVHDFRDETDMTSVEYEFKERNIQDEFEEKAQPSGNIVIYQRDVFFI